MRKATSIFKLLLTLLLCSILQVQARWATREDAAIIRESFTSDTIIHKDGTYTATYAFEDAIAKDYAREYAAGYTLYYTKGISKLTILSAKTILHGVEYKIPKSKIEDKPLASSPHGFDQRHQVLISFPKAEVGAKIYLKYKIEYNKVPLPGTFGLSYFFGIGESGLPTYWKKARMQIRSKIPLYFKINDPDNALKVTQSETQPGHNLSVDLIKPLIKATINEPEESVLNPKYQCWVSCSSFRTWEQVAGAFANDYDAVINQPLPQKLRDILQEAQKKEGDVDQINEVTSLLSSQIQYMGDWQSIKGLYTPRPLKIVTKTGLGDCKDFSACAASILRNMGYKVNAALVWRGNDPPSEDSVPMYNANHAILKVTGKQGKIYWVDPTNFQSMAQGTFPDIAGKMAFVLDPENPLHERIPEVSPESSQMEDEEIIFIKDQCILEISETYIRRGEHALPFCGLELNMSPQSIVENLFYLMSGIHLQPHEKKSIKLPDLKSKIVQNIAFQAVYDQPNGVYKSNLGICLPLLKDPLSALLGATHEQVNDLFVEIPMKIIYKKRIKNGPVPNIEKLNYGIKTPWVEVKRVCRNIGKESEIITTIAFLKRYIPAEDLNSKAYKDLKESLRWNMKDVIVILNDTQTA